MRKKEKTKLEEINITALSLPITGHAQHRAAQRNLNRDEISYVLDYGRLIQRTGISFCFLGVRDVPLIDRRLSWVQHLVGVTLLLDEGEEGELLLTAYRNSKALHAINKKTKYRMTKLEQNTGHLTDDFYAV